MEVPILLMINMTISSNTIYTLCVISLVGSCTTCSIAYTFDCRELLVDYVPSHLLFRWNLSGALDTMVYFMITYAVIPGQPLK